MNRSIYCCYAPIKPHQHHVIIFFISNFPIIVFNINFLNIYISLTFLLPLPFHLPTTSPTFLPPLSFHLPITLYINIILPLSIHLHLLCLFLFIPSYYKFVTTSSILCIVFPHKKCSLSHNFFVDFFLKFFLQLYFRLIFFIFFKTLFWVNAI